MPAQDHKMGQPLEVALVGLRHPHAVPGHEPVGWTDTLTYCHELRITAACDSSAEGRELLSRYLPSTPIYRDIATMLQCHPAVTAALVFLPNDEVGDALDELTQAGIHVALDKPGARASRELTRVLENVRQKQLITAVAYTWRMNSLARKLRRLVSSGRLGVVWSVEMRLLATNVATRGAKSPLFSRELSGGGILHWLGCHWLDLLAFVTRSEIRSVQAVTANVGGQPIDVEDLAILTMRLENGVVANLVTGYLLPSGSQADIAVRGEHGWADADMTYGKISTYIEGVGSNVIEPSRNASEIHGYGGRSAVDFLQAFARAVTRRENAVAIDSTGVGTELEPAPFSDRTFATLEDAVRVLAVVEAGYASAAAGRAIEPTYPLNTPQSDFEDRL